MIYINSPGRNCTGVQITMHVSAELKHTMGSVCIMQRSKQTTPQRESKINMIVSHPSSLKTTQYYPSSCTQAMHALINLYYTFNHSLSVFAQITTSHPPSHDRRLAHHTSDTLALSTMTCHIWNGLSSTHANTYE